MPLSAAGSDLFTSWPLVSRYSAMRRLLFLAAQIRGIHESAAEAPRRLSCAFFAFFLSPIPAEMPSAKTFASSSAQSSGTSHSLGSRGTSSIEFLPVTPHTERGTEVEFFTRCAFINVTSAPTPPSPRLSLPRTSMDVSFEVAFISSASCSPSEGVSSASRRSIEMSPWPRAYTQPASSMIRAGPRAFHPLRLRSGLSIALSSRLISLHRVRCR
mmetsp:Transcript_82060/g.163411  ORF Transcript_82060/g.163411 Transcript_82060/m.163411 type:complete len:214 (-) Transcript_82060:2443-3084(-)